MKNIWKTLKKPIFILAPMDDVTDTVFRQVILKTCQPDIFYTEFTNCEGLFSAGSEKIMQRLKFAKEEKPIVAQLWGINPDNFEKAARFCKKLGFDGIDINMGCPDKKAVKSLCCAHSKSQFGPKNY